MKTANFTLKDWRIPVQLSVYRYRSLKTMRRAIRKLPVKYTKGVAYCYQDISKKEYKIQIFLNDERSDISSIVHEIVHAVTFMFKDAPVSLHSEEFADMVGMWTKEIYSWWELGHYMGNNFNCAYRWKNE